MYPGNDLARNIEACLPSQALLRCLAAEKKRIGQIRAPRAQAVALALAAPSAQAQVAMAGLPSVGILRRFLAWLREAPSSAKGALKERMLEFLRGEMARGGQSLRTAAANAGDLVRGLRSVGVSGVPALKRERGLWRRLAATIPTKPHRPLTLNELLGLLPRLPFALRAMAAAAWAMLARISDVLRLQARDVLRDEEGPSHPHPALIVFLPNKASTEPVTPLKVPPSPFTTLLWGHAQSAAPNQLLWSKSDWLKLRAELPQESGAHSFRRGAAQLLAAQGLGGEEVSEALRHLSLLTKQRYLKEMGGWGLQGRRRMAKAFR